MSISPHTTVVSDSTSPAGEVRIDSESLRIQTRPILRVGERLLAGQALVLLNRIDRDLKEAALNLIRIGFDD